VFDRSINLSAAGKLAGIYGVNVIPMDFIDTTGIPWTK